MQATIGRYLDDADELFNWLHGVVVGVPVLHLACRSGLAERLAQGPTTFAELADATGIPVDRIERVIRYMARHELLELSADGIASATSRTARVQQWAGLWQQMINTLYAGSGLTPALREGRTGFEEKFGAPAFEHFAANPGMGAAFAEFMGFMTGRTLDFVLSSHRFEPFDTVVDVGGSFGALLLAVLDAYPGARGILFDRPDVVAQAETRIAASPLAARVECAGGSFFEHVPPGDLYLLKQILHDWDDGECGRILGAVRRAIAPGGRVAVIDHILPVDGRPTEADSTDIAMMIWATGRERTLDEFQVLFAASGFALVRVTENPRGHSIIEAIPV